MRIALTAFVMLVVLAPLAEAEVIEGTMSMQRADGHPVSVVGTRIHLLCQTGENFAAIGAIGPAISRVAVSSTRFASEVRSSPRLSPAQRARDKYLAAMERQAHVRQIAYHIINQTRAGSINETRVDRDGYFRFSDVAPGRYFLVTTSVEEHGWPGPVSMWVMPVEVGSSTVTVQIDRRNHTDLYRDMAIDVVDRIVTEGANEMHRHGGRDGTVLGESRDARRRGGAMPLPEGFPLEPTRACSP